MRQQAQGMTAIHDNKVKSVQGCINELKMILNWSEEPFDEEYYKDQ